MGEDGILSGMDLFLGEYRHSLDVRNRVSLPKKIRDKIKVGKVILAKGFEGCIFGFEPESWTREAAHHLEVSVTEQRARRLRRYLFSSAIEVRIDKLGRILIPANLKEHARLGNEAVVIGAGDHFEVWSPRNWEGELKKL